MKWQFVSVFFYSDVITCFFFLRKFPFERKNAFHGHCGLSHLLEVSLWLSSGSSWKFRIARAFLKYSLTVICNIHNSNRALYFVSLNSFPSFFALRIVSFFVGEWMDNLFQFYMYLSSSICKAEGASDHILDHDYNFLFCS